MFCATCVKRMMILLFISLHSAVSALMLAEKHSRRLRSLAGFFEKYPLVSPLEVCKMF